MTLNRNNICLGLLSLALIASTSVQAIASTYEYDTHGRVVAVTYDDGSTVIYEYDNAGNRTNVVRSPPPPGMGAAQDSQPASDSAELDKNLSANAGDLSHSRHEDLHPPGVETAD